MWVRDWSVEWFPVAITDEIAPSSLAVFAPVIDLGIVKSLLDLTCIRLSWPPSGTGRPAGIPSKASVDAPKIFHSPPALPWTVVRSWQ
jgi:hypothetical protein